MTLQAGKLYQDHFNERETDRSSQQLHEPLISFVQKTKTTKSKKKIHEPSSISAGAERGNQESWHVWRKLQLYYGRQTCPPPRSEDATMQTNDLSRNIVLQKQTEKKKKINTWNENKKAKDIMTTLQDKRRQPYNLKIARACQTNATIARAPKIDNKLNAMLKDSR